MLTELEITRDVKYLNTKYILLILFESSLGMSLNCWVVKN